MPRPHLIFINRFFWPDESATSRMLSDLTFWLADRGWRVTVLTSRQLYTDAKAPLEEATIHEGVQIKRLWSTSFGRHSLCGRALDYFSFYLSLFIALLKVVKRGDVLVGKTDPPMASSLAASVARIKGAMAVHWLQDVFPEVAQVGLSARSRRVLDALRLLRNFSISSKDRVVVLSSDMECYMQTQLSCETHIAIIPNWAVGEEIEPVAISANHLREEWGYAAGDFVLGYSGNFGRTHDVATIMDAAAPLSASAVNWLFVGAGARLDRLKEAFSGSNQARFEPYQAREDLAASLSVPDVHWFSLEPAYTSYVFPSKFYGIMAAGRPCIFVGKKDSALARCILENSLGYVVVPGDVEGFVRAVATLQSDAARRMEMGKRARAWFEANGQLEASAERWESLLLDASPAHRC